MTDPRADLSDAIDHMRWVMTALGDYDEGSPEQGNFVLTVMRPAMHRLVEAFEKREQMDALMQEAVEALREDRHTH